MVMKTKNIKIQKKRDVIKDKLIALRERKEQLKAETNRTEVHTTEAVIEWLETLEPGEVFVCDEGASCVSFEIIEGESEEEEEKGLVFGRNSNSCLKDYIVEGSILMFLKAGWHEMRHSIRKHNPPKQPIFITKWLINEQVIWLSGGDRNSGHSYRRFPLGHLRYLEDDKKL